MELVAVLRALWRFRLLVVVGCLVAGGLGYMATKGATTYQGVATTRVMLDTPTSQTLEANSLYGPSLEWRSALVGDLMSTDATRKRVAREMGIAADQLVIQAPYMAVPPVAAQLPRHALEVGTAVSEPYELAIQGVALLPIVTIGARAPTRAKAAKLAARGAEAVKAKASEPTVPGGQFVVQQISPIRTREIVNGPRKAIAATVTVLVFTLWCAAITLMSGLRDRRKVHRRASRLTRPQPISS
jgi:hypothetical protein